MRAFVAVDLGGSEGDTARRAAPEHLTLRFLGEISVEQARLAERLLVPVGRQFRPFHLNLEGVGAFPSADRPRVVWQGVSVGRAELSALALAVRAALAPAFGEERGPFVAHRTLFRVRSPVDRDRARELLEGRRPAPPALSTTVAAFQLKESVLGSRGATHTTIASFPLAGEGGSPD